LAAGQKSPCSVAWIASSPGAASVAAGSSARTPSLAASAVRLAHSARSQAARTGSKSCAPAAAGRSIDLEAASAA
jgi:hypothetical protein